MPNRIIREGINSSPRVDALSAGAELFYRRLISVVDDYGRFYAIPATLRGACWPTRPEKATEDDICVWLCECLDNKLLEIYESSGIRFLQMSDFKQQIRAKSKFPQFDSNCSAVASHMLITSRSRSRISESEACVCVAPDASPASKQQAAEQREPETHTPKSVTLHAVAPAEPFERMYAAHPIKGWKSEARKALADALKRSGDPGEEILRIERAHLEWCSYWNSGGSRKVGMQIWLENSLYLESPSRDPPSRMRSEVLAGLDAIDRIKGRV